MAYSGSYLLGGPVPRTRNTVVVSMPGFDAGFSLPCDRTSNFAKTPFRIYTQKQSIKNPYQMGAVNSFGENGRREREFGGNRQAGVNSFPPGTARNLGFSGPQGAAGDYCEMKNGGAGSLERTRLRREFPVKQGKNREFSRITPESGLRTPYNALIFLLLLVGFPKRQNRELPDPSREFLARNREFGRPCRLLATRSISPTALESRTQLGQPDAGARSTPDPLVRNAMFFCGGQNSW